MATRHSHSAARIMMATALMPLLGWTLVSLKMTLWLSFLPDFQAATPHRRQRALGNSDCMRPAIVAGPANVRTVRHPRPCHRAILRHADRVGAGPEDHAHGTGACCSGADPESLGGPPVEWSSHASTRSTLPIAVEGAECSWSRTFGVSGPQGSDTLLPFQGMGIAETIASRADGEVGFWRGDCLHLIPHAIFRLDSGGLGN